MVLRLIGLLFAALALVLGVSYGWASPLGALLQRINPRGLASFRDGVQQNLPHFVWDALVSPILTMPAWSAAAAICVVLFLISAMRPGRG